MPAAQKRPVFFVIRPCVQPTDARMQKKEEGGNEETDHCACRVVAVCRHSAGSDVEGSARSYARKMERDDRAVQDHRQRLLRRNRWPCVLPDHIAAGPYPG